MKDIAHLFTTLETRDTGKFAVFEKASLTYLELLEKVKKITLLFNRRGFKKGDRLVLSVSNDQDTTVFFIAALRNGIAPVLIDPQVKRERANAIIRAADPQGFIVDETLMADWNIPSAAPAIIVRQGQQKKGKLFAKLLGKGSPEDPEAGQFYPASTAGLEPSEARFPEAVPPQTIAYIIYTSGTTSDSKGVAITHKNLFTHLRTLSGVYGLTEKANILNLLNLYHADGIIQGPVLALYNQATLYRPFHFSISETGALFLSIYQLRITHAFLVPTILSLMDKFSEGYEDSFQTEDFQMVISVSSHIEAALWKRFSEKFKTIIVNVYGLTETVAGSLFCGPGPESFRMGTVGKPVDCEVKLIDESGSEAAIGQEGELLLKGAHIMHAYFNNKPATEEALKEDWLHTGDIGLRDSEGFYHITGRKKNIIISGGFNIHPEEITEILNSHPDVSESVSFGIPDEVFGEKLVSCVVLHPNSKSTEAQLTAYCREKLEPEKVPAKIQFLPALPRGLSGKVQQAATRQLFDASQEQQQNSNGSILATIINTAAGAFRVPEQTISRDSTSYTVSGWDSLSHLILITELEEIYNVRFSTAEVMVMNSIAGIEKIITGKLS
ncbi:AMP-binding protein [Niabella hirudinis]|uniref:AMP-binding protein n=1 Tax=Niabella hirudinis TaxID=1285929 RepID=UPI003EBF7555